MKRVLLACVLAAAACGGGEKSEPAAGGGEQAATTTEASGQMGEATISGTMKFTGTPPTNPTIDMAEEPACKEKYQQAPRQEITVVGPNGGLANVFVHVKSGLPAGATYSAPGAAVVIDQDGCEYIPRVLGIMANQPLEIRNSDPLLHNIKAKPEQNRPFNISQPAAGMKTTRTFSASEVMIPLECNVHGWMQAYVGVKEHPFFSVSDSSGSFTIARLPAGTYELEAWHEKYGTQTATVTVTGAETKTQDFTFSAK